MEKQVDRLEQQIAEIDQQLADPGIYQANEKKRLTELLQRKGEVQPQLESSEEQLLELYEALEAQ